MLETLGTSVPSLHLLWQVGTTPLHEHFHSYWQYLPTPVQHTPKLFPRSLHLYQFTRFNTILFSTQSCRAITPISSCAVSNLGLPLAASAINVTASVQSVTAMSGLLLWCGFATNALSATTKTNVLCAVERGSQMPSTVSNVPAWRRTGTAARRL